MGRSVYFGRICYEAQAVADPPSEGKTVAAAQKGQAQVEEDEECEEHARHYMEGMYSFYRARDVETPPPFLFQGHVTGSL